MRNAPFDFFFLNTSPNTSENLDCLHHSIGKECEQEGRNERQHSIAHTNGRVYNGHKDFGTSWQFSIESGCVSLHVGIAGEKEGKKSW